MGRRGPPLPLLRQLHDGLPDVFLLDGERFDLSERAKATRTREWELCYTLQFTYTTTGPERNTIRGRYRHWLRHKLCTWWDQFRHQRLHRLRPLHHLVPGGHRPDRGDRRGSARKRTPTWFARRDRPKGI